MLLKLLVAIKDLIFTSGQVGLDPVTGTLVEGGIKDQIEQVLKNIDSILNDAGLSRKNIIKLTVFLIDLSQFNMVNESFKAFFMDVEFPARSTVEVSKLPLDALVEIECIASR